MSNLRRTLEIVYRNTDPKKLRMTTPVSSRTNDKSYITTLNSSAPSHKLSTLIQRIQYLHQTNQVAIEAIDRFVLEKLGAAAHEAARPSTQAPTSQPTRGWKSRRS